MTKALITVFLMVFGLFLFWVLFAGMTGYWTKLGFISLVSLQTSLLTMGVLGAIAFLCWLLAGVLIKQR